MFNCVNYTVRNTNNIRPIVINWRACNGQTRRQTLKRNGSMTMCALNNSVTSTFKGFASIVRNCNCYLYFVTNNGEFNQEFKYVSCNGLDSSKNIGPGETINICMCRPCVSNDITSFTLEQRQICFKGLPITPTPSVTPIPSNTPSNTPTNTNTPTVTPTNTSTPSTTSSPTPTLSLSLTPTTTPTPSSTPCPSCRVYRFNLSYDDVAKATGNAYNNGYVYLDTSTCRKYCGGTAPFWDYITAMSSMNPGETRTFDWCVGITGETFTSGGAVTGAPWSQIYIYRNNQKVTTGLTSTFTETSECCTGETFGQYAYVLNQTVGEAPSSPNLPGNLVFYDGVVINNVDAMTGFSMNSFDATNRNLNSQECDSLSGLSVSGGQVTFSQNGTTAIFSGDASLFMYSDSKLTGTNLTLVQSAGITFDTGTSVNFGFTLS